MHRIAAIMLAVILSAAAVPALADEDTGTKALKEQIKSLQDANVVMKEDLAKTQLQLHELAAQNQARAEAAKKELTDLAKQIAELRQALADEQAKHEAALQKEQAEHEAELQKTQAEAARQRSRAKDRQLWLYMLGGIALITGLRY